MYGSTSCHSSSRYVAAHELLNITDSQYLGTKLNWRLLDPIGGMVLSTYITVEWIKTLLQNFANRKSINPLFHKLTC